MRIPLAARGPRPIITHNSHPILQCAMPLGRARAFKRPPRAVGDDAGVSGNGAANHDESSSDDDGFPFGLSPVELETFTTVAGTVDIVDEDEAEVDVFGELSTGGLHFVEDLEDEEEALLEGGSLKTLGLRHPLDILEVPSGEVARRVDSLLDHLGVTPSPYPDGEPQRAIYCSRTLNMRAIQAIG